MKVELKIKNVQCGRATKPKSGYSITIPQWAFERSTRDSLARENYWIYYICHELAHVMHHSLFGNWGGHIDSFKAIEDMYLADFGLRVERAKAYPRGQEAGIKQLEQSKCQN